MTKIAVAMTYHSEPSLTKRRKVKMNEALIKMEKVVAKSNRYGIGARLCSVVIVRPNTVQVSNI